MSFGRFGALAVLSAQDVGRAARDGRTVIDDGELGHAFAVLLLSFAQPRLELVLGRGCGPLRLLAQRLWAHDDSLAVTGDDEGVGVGGGGSIRLLVEGLDVGSGALGELFDLALAEHDPGGALERGLCLVVAAPGRLDRAALSQAVAVALPRQVQRGVLEVEVLLVLGPVGETGDADLAEDRLEAAPMVRLARSVRDASGVDDVFDAPLASSPQVEVVLEELAEQRSAVGLEASLELFVGETGGVAAAKEGGEVEKAGLGGAECRVVATAQRGLS